MCEDVNQKVKLRLPEAKSTRSPAHIKFGIMSLNEGAAGAADKRGPKLRRSCELCRNSKGRCIPSQEDSNRCQRCVRDEKQCLFLEAKPRPKRAKNSRIRVAEMEQKLDGLMALLSSSNVDKVVSVASQPYPSPAESGLTPLSEITNGTFSQGLLDSIISPTDNSKPNQPLGFSSFPLYPPFDRLQDVISQGLVGFQQADEYVQVFKSKAHTFPFVVIPTYMSLDTLRREKPFLLLAILAFATDADTRLQDQLELELRESLSRKIIVNGEKSLDLLQGLLVYLTWYHFFFDMGQQQVYQLCQMAAAMLVDLEFHKKVRERPVSNTSLMIGVPLNFFAKISEEELDARRTYIGCYYITSQISQNLRKPNILKSNDFLEECAESLAAANHKDTDYLMPFFVHIQRLSDEVNRAFDYDNTSQLPPLNAMRVEVLVQAFQQRFSHLQTVLPEKAFNNLSLKMTFYRLGIYINEIGFHAAPPSEAEAMMSDQSSLQSWYYSVERNNCLINCLTATKEYLDKVLALTDSELLEFTLIEFVSLVYALLILGSFATKCNDQMLDAAYIRKSANFEFYIDGLSDKLVHLIAATRTPSSNPCLDSMYDLFQQSKIWYTQMTLDSNSASVLNSGHLEHSFMHILPTIMSRCVDFKLVGSGVPSSLPDWSDMVSSSPLEPSFITINHCL